MLRRQQHWKSVTCARSDSQSVKLRGHSDRTSTSFSARQYPFMLQTLDRFNLERLARPKQCFCCAAVELTSTHEIGGAVSEKSQPRVGFRGAVYSSSAKARQDPSSRGSHGRCCCKSGDFLTGARRVEKCGKYPFSWLQAGAGSQLGFVLPGSPSHSSSEAARHLGSKNDGVSRYERQPWRG